MNRQVVNILIELIKTSDNRTNGYIITFWMKIEKSIPKLFAAILAWEKEIVNKATNHTTNQKSYVPVRQEGGFSLERTG